MTTTMMNRTTTTILMIMGLFINDVTFFLKMKTVLKICEVTIKIEAIMKTITMMRLISHRCAVV